MIVKQRKIVACCTTYTSTFFQKLIIVQLTWLHEALGCLIPHFQIFSYTLFALFNWSIKATIEVDNDDLQTYTKQLKIYVVHRTRFFSVHKKLLFLLHFRWIFDFLHTQLQCPKVPYNFHFSPYIHISLYSLNFNNLTSHALFEVDSSCPQFSRDKFRAKTL